VPISAINPLAVPAFPKRRVLIALWVSAAAHLTLLAFIRVSPSPAQAHSEPLRVWLEKPESVETPVPLLQSEVSSDALETVPLPQTQVSSQPATSAPQPEPQQTATPHLDLPQLADPTYYDVLALDSPNLQPIGKIEPVDPEAGSSNPHTGYVRLQLKLESDGRVNEVAVLETNLPAEYEKVALNAFRGAKFYPARKNGRPVRAQFKVELTFKLPPENSR
jgi:periplasmic protein TonB